ncbi:NlpC/P60 family protein [Alloscardovia omnicolens]|nr:C40 family peptidase [Alloscardovia omnicolens]MDK6642917.1 NlpC/P60 family protein [Alloscardovia omnicolens]
MSSGKHRASSASAPVTPFNTHSAFFKASRVFANNRMRFKIGAVAISSLLVVALAGSTASNFANATGAGVVSASGVSRSEERSSLTQETATVSYVQGDEWSLSSDSSAVTVKYEMTPDQSAARDKLVSAYNTAQAEYGTLSSASSSTLKALADALNTAAGHLADTTNSADTYNSDISSLNGTLSKAKSSHNSARSAAASSSSSSAGSFTGAVSGSGSGVDVANYSLQFVGAPYSWGGNTPAGWDCSGFVQYVYSHFGVSLPRTSGAQAGVGVAVASLAEAQPGDIIANGMHAAIYIGNGMVMNAMNYGLGTKTAPVSYAFSGSYSIRRVLS